VTIDLSVDSIYIQRFTFVVTTFDVFLGLVVKLLPHPIFDLIFKSWTNKCIPNYLQGNDKM